MNANYYSNTGKFKNINTWEEYTLLYISVSYILQIIEIITHADDSLDALLKANTLRFKHYACESCKTRQYSHLSTDEGECLSNVMTAIEKITKNPSNYFGHLKHFGLLTWFFDRGVYYQCQEHKEN